MGGRLGNPSTQGSEHSTGPQYTYKISVKTGDRPKAGTDANVYIVLYGEGLESKETKLDACFHNDFERGQQDSFHIKHLPVRMHITA